MKPIEDSQVIKDNVLIANFMGWDEFNTGSYHTPYDNASYCNGEETSICNKYALKFHSSWEWLMPVIHKIIKTIGVRSIDECSKVEWFVSTRVTQMYIGINIEHAHYYCVEFIHWYNKQNKQS